MTVSWSRISGVCPLCKQLTAAVRMKWTIGTSGIEEWYYHPCTSVEQLIRFSPAITTLMHLLMSMFGQSGLSTNHRVGGPTSGSSCPHIEVFLSTAWPQILQMVRTCMVHSALVWLCVIMGEFPNSCHFPLTRVGSSHIGLLLIWVKSFINVGHPSLI